MIKLYSHKQMVRMVELTREWTLADPSGPLPPLPAHIGESVGNVSDPVWNPKPKKLNIIQRIIGLIKASPAYYKPVPKIPPPDPQSRHKYIK